MASAAASAVACALLLLAPPFAEGHGYLATPRSRNLLAYEETSWNSRTTDDPMPEVCPQCLNQGGPDLSRCGITGEHNYDAPRNALGGLMKARIQESYSQGDKIRVDVVLTAHHMGHFEFSACPIKHGEIPQQDCFDRYQLTFVKDLLYGGVADENYPERAYVAPMKYSLKKSGDSYMNEVSYSFLMQLPRDLHGDLVLIQWYYLTGNSCVHQGYKDYKWPSKWDVNVSGSDNCSPTSFEKFWNCAEASISPKQKSSLDDSKADSVNKPGGKTKPGKLNTGSNKPKKEKAPCKKIPGGKRRPKDKDKECDKFKPNRRSKKAGIRHKMHNRMKMVPH